MPVPCSYPEWLNKWDLNYLKVSLAKAVQLGRKCWDDLSFNIFVTVSVD